MDYGLRLPPSFQLELNYKFKLINEMKLSRKRQLVCILYAINSK